MTYYQLLGDPMECIDANYEGTYRSGPTYASFLPLDDPLNQMFLKYVDGNSRFSDVGAALKLASMYEQVGKKFDVVRINVMGTKPDYIPNDPLGFDVSIAGWWSMLSWGLAWKQVSYPIGPILSLVELYFRPKLNKHGLFSQWEEAHLFVEIVKAVSTLAPGTFESDENVVALEIVQLVSIKA